MCRHIHDTLALLLHIEVPLRAAQRLTRDILEEVVNTLLGDGRLLGRTLLHLTEEFRHSHQHTLQLVVNLTALGHNIVDHHATLRCRIESLLKHLETLAVDSHRLVCQHIDTSIHRRLHISCLLAVVTRQNEHITSALLNHSLQVVIARIEVFNPRCGALGARVVTLDAVEVHLNIGTLGSIDMHRGVNLVVHIHLHQRRVEVTRVERQQLDLILSAAELAELQLLTTHQSDRSNSQNRRKNLSHIL